ncbi:hypothetical protein FRX31_008795 [Thalictrum thalictroides]|uniref:Uncharacterized protein n=1 Tax=Thalictrum thalictroides TaxID=46969 RepID=A0A7J6WYF2_THATH|nr:hypothetical protein FRX31_008795 [Thalictrum thalictroides]
MMLMHFLLIQAGGEFSGSNNKKNQDMVPRYSSPDTLARTSLSLNSPVMLDDNDIEDFDENRNSMYTTPPHDSLRNKAQKDETNKLCEKGHHNRMCIGD